MCFEIEYNWRLMPCTYDARPEIIIAMESLCFQVMLQCIIFISAWLAAHLCYLTYECVSSLIFLLHMWKWIACAGLKEQIYDSFKFLTSNVHKQARTSKHAQTSTHKRARTNKHAQTSMHKQARTNKHARYQCYLCVRDALWRVLSTPRAVGELMTIGFDVIGFECDFDDIDRLYFM